MPLVLGACSESDELTPGSTIDPDLSPPTNTILIASFRDTDSRIGRLGGSVSLSMEQKEDFTSTENISLRLYWANDSERLDLPFIDLNKFAMSSAMTLEIDLPDLGNIPVGAKAFKLYLANSAGESSLGVNVRFHDFIGNALLSGPGGDEEQSWFYGQDRRKIPIYRTSDDSSLCVFDNGLVSVIDMANEIDEALHWGSDDGVENQADEVLFPPYSFQCESNPVNHFREISDEYGVWTYSTLNDAMHYGLIVYDMFLKYLGEPPLEEKIRLRVHYGSLNSQYAFWDGAYANFSDAYPFYYSMASLDAIAHEVAHGVLNRISDIDFFSRPLSTDARTVHEAFADISGLMAMYEFHGHSDHWIHGEGFYGYARYLDQIVTEASAIESYLDYDDAGDNFYLRIGMMTYPFFLLSNQWGIESAYEVYLAAAKNCWFAEMSLPDSAHCIEQEASTLGYDEEMVVKAFKTVKIRLFEEGVLGHFFYQADSLMVEFLDNSQSTSSVSDWFWEFGDGTSSTEANPRHQYAQPGEYAVKLTVVDYSGDKDTFERHIQLYDDL
jgi:hypothetical protein